MQTTPNLRLEIQSKILAALRLHKPDWLAGPWELRTVQPGAYKFQSGEAALFIKWIAAGDLYGENELRTNQAWLPDPLVRTPRFIFSAPAEGGTVAAWEWVGGEDLRAAHRERLPQAFAQIGRFHSAHREAGSLAMYVNGPTYGTVSELLNSELRRLCTSYPEPLPQNRVITLLSTGYGTRLHGDLHPGNLHLSGEALFLTDWGYAHTGLNWLELEYVRTVELEADPEEWWIIRPEEAGACLQAYAAAAGLEPYDLASTHWAVMLWAELHAHANALTNQNVRGVARCRRNIAHLMSIEPPIALSPGKF